MTEQQTFPSLEGKQFIYDMHTAFPNKGNHIAVVERTHIATNVVQTGTNCWEFNLSGLEGRFHTCYGWSLVLDTPINRERVAGYERLLALSEQAKTMLVESRGCLETLQPESEKEKLMAMAKNMMVEG